MSDNTRATFGSKLGIILASVGSAVGLGNIWRFPYEAGTGGGGAFLIVYLLCVLCLGLPLMTAEFVIGRRSGTNAVRAFEKLSGRRGWGAIGALGVFTSVLIIGFYSVVAGWTLEYIFISATENMQGASADSIARHFTDFVSDPVRPVVTGVLFLLLTHLIIVCGVKNGIERCAKILMPALFVILLVLCIRSLLLPGASAGLRFLFAPDFTKITPMVVLSALGQAFFSLSLGCACMITYASYFNRSDNLRTSALSVTLLDTVIAILAGVMIFPAVFSFGIAPSQGPTLVFVTLPNIFAQLPLSNLWSLIFFLLLALAALTSIISLHEVATSFLSERFAISRSRGALAVTALCAVLSAVCSLSLGVWDGVKIFSMNIFDTFDFLTASILLPLGSLLVCIFAGWVMHRSDLYDELSSGGLHPFKGTAAYVFFLRFIAPVAILVIFLHQLGIF